MNENQVTIADIENFLNQLASNKDWLYLIMPASIGDIIYTGGLSYAVQKRKGKSATVFVLRDRMKNFSIQYENFAHFVYLSDMNMTILQQYFYVTGKYETDNIIYGHFKDESKGVRGWADLKYHFSDLNLHAIDRFKKDVFNIPMDTPFLLPKIAPITSENISELNQKYTLDKEKTIILFPYTWTIKPPDPSFWVVMAQELKKKNYIVYTNVDGFSAREKAIAGTNPIVTNFREMYYISDKIKCFVGMRQ